MRDIMNIAADTDLACGAVAHVKKGEARALKAGGQWLYDNEIEHVSGNFENGNILEVQDFDGYVLGYGFINTNSKIRIRMLSRRAETGSLPHFWKRGCEQPGNTARQ